ncbi:peptide ABC transporter ATPase [Anopheles sinensis]|uniref:Peptide ABC transporter ATPase n=1 Tax=Anopheles sinensis TaxID=74873 RepID=A0A084W8H9_ANOSI|nr:peptide ABC transporter ATPase [Anopheles sinensis]
MRNRIEPKPGPPKKPPHRDVAKSNTGNCSKRTTAKHSTRVHLASCNFNHFCRCRLIPTRGPLSVVGDQGLYALGTSHPSGLTGTGVQKVQWHPAQCNHPHLRSPEKGWLLLLRMLSGLSTHCGGGIVKVNLPTDAQLPTVDESEANLVLQIVPAGDDTAAKATFEFPGSDRDSAPQSHRALTPWPELGKRNVLARSMLANGGF